MGCNLARHLQVLEKDGMIKIFKEQDQNRLQTMVRISTAGRKRYIEYLQTLEQVVLDAAKAAKDESVSKPLRGLTPTRA